MDESWKGTTSHVLTDRIPWSTAFATQSPPGFLHYAGNPPLYHAVTLTSLSLGFNETSIGVAFHCLKTLFAFSALRGLRHFKLDIKLNIGPYGASQPLVSVAFGDILKFLLPLVHLHSISFYFEASLAHALDVSEDDLKLVASTWPPLSSLVPLSLDYGPLWWEDETEEIYMKGIRPSLTSLISFIECCPHLDTLIVDFADVTNDELDRLEIRLAENRTFAHVALEWLAPTRTLSREVVVDDVGRLVEMLCAAFPHFHVTM
ncbi:hypothetical protein BD309DRAFT_474054 [Dichomitus squalens]|uniref:Uncharacterized protein n=1 Tax=Dichomitus squalens TaxID=114155 RepID=A0A4Q9NIE0_9APHY|nr:hypothetical protein BD309DRAFT_474054 [Dichomitus squalens]TBU52144.1 hypothetical protein BD310DRAFT_258502 [Dichomitus squalens]